MKNNIMRIIASAAALIMLSGCSRAAEENTASEFSQITSSAEFSEASENAENIEESGNETVNLRVTSYDGKTLTGSKMREMERDRGGHSEDMPERPEGEPPESGEMPERPEGEIPKEGDMPRKPDGGKMPEDEEITLNITENSVIDGEIAEGDMITAVIDENNNIISASKMQFEGKPGGDFGSRGNDNGTSANVLESGDISGASYESSGDDENAARADNTSVTLTDCTVNKKGGSSSNTENGDFYGMNAALLAMNGASLTVNGGEVSSSAVNGNGIFCFGSGTVVNVSNTRIRTTERNSGGIQTTGGGTMNANDLDILTEGASSAAIRSDRGGGKVTVSGGTYVTNGTGSPSVYCTADISVSGAVLTANNSEGIVVEGKNSVRLSDCTVSGDMKGTYSDGSENIQCIMIYQSMSGDAEQGEAYFEAQGGSISSLSGDMFYVTNTACKINIKNVEFSPADGYFLNASGNDSSRGWGKQGENGASVKLNAEDQTIEGDIFVDSISSLDLDLSSSTLKGAVNKDGAAGDVSVTLDGKSQWILTGDSYISAFNGDVSNISAGSFHVYVNGDILV